jgi:hypothetical protein
VIDRSQSELILREMRNRASPPGAIPERRRKRVEAPRPVPREVKVAGVS